MLLDRALRSVENTYTSFLGVSNSLYSGPSRGGTDIRLYYDLPRSEGRQTWPSRGMGVTVGHLTDPDLHCAGLEVQRVLACSAGPEKV